MFNGYYKFQKIRLYIPLLIAIRDGALGVIKNKQAVSTI
jgi:hypothetical protein